MARRPSAAKSDLLVARVTPRRRALLQRAADLSGRTITDFLVSSAEAAAEETIRAHQVLDLTERETEAFFTALESPPEFDEKMREAGRWHRDNVEVRW